MTRRFKANPKTVRTTDEREAVPEVVNEAEMGFGIGSYPVV